MALYLLKKTKYVTPVTQQANQSHTFTPRET